SPRSNATRTPDTGSAPVSMANATVNAAPMPTHTAYEVPVGRLRIAIARPTMLSANATTNTTLGPSRVRPSDFPRAVAHTASITPDTTNTNHATRFTSTRRLVVTGYVALVRDPLGSRSERTARGARLARTSRRNRGRIEPRRPRPPPPPPLLQ